MEKIGKRGGAREGAGRPKGVKKPYKPLCCSLPEDYVKRAKTMAEKEGLSLGKLLQKMIDSYS